MLKQKQQQADGHLECAEIWERNKELSLQKSAPLWKKLLRIDPADERLHELRILVPKLRRESYELGRALEQVESSIKSVRHVRKRLESAARQAAHMRKGDLKKQEFDERSRGDISGTYGREQFKISKKDYKRGNLLDNHFRSAFVDAALDAFYRRCLFCGSEYDLTLDHFGIPKNEGGNFVLALRDNNGIRMNLIVLCRSCNAAKGEIPCHQFFNETQLARATAYQKRLLQRVLSDNATMQVIRSWYGIHL